MGASESTDIHDVPDRRLVPSDIQYGVRVCSVVQGSPAHLAGLEIFFDHIIGANATCYIYRKNAVALFSDLIKNSVDTTVKLFVYNTRFKAFRDVSVTPQRSSDAETHFGTIGVSVALNPNVTEDLHGLRVLKVFPNSPASSACLIEDTDMLMGTIEVVFRVVDDFTQLLCWRSSTRAYDTLTLVVYNIQLETVRTVELQPKDDWGGSGCCGVSVGCGALHRIPPPRHLPKGIYFEYPPLSQPSCTTSNDSSPQNAKIANPCSSSEDCSLKAPNLPAAVKEQNLGVKENSVTHTTASNCSNSTVSGAAQPKTTLLANEMVSASTPYLPPLSSLKSTELTSDTSCETCSHTAETPQAPSVHLTTQTRSWASLQRSEVPHHQSLHTPVSPAVSEQSLGHAVLQSSDIAMTLPSSPGIIFVSTMPRTVLP